MFEQGVPSDRRYGQYSPPGWYPMSACSKTHKVVLTPHKPSTNDLSSNNCDVGTPTLSTSYPRQFTCRSTTEELPLAVTVRSVAAGSSGVPSQPYGLVAVRPNPHCRPVRPDLWSALCGCRTLCLCPSAGVRIRDSLWSVSPHPIVVPSDQISAGIAVPSGGRLRLVSIAVSEPVYSPRKPCRPVTRSELIHRKNCVVAPKSGPACRLYTLCSNTHIVTVRPQAYREWCCRSPVELFVQVMCAGPAYRRQLLVEPYPYCGPVRPYSLGSRWR